MDISANDTESGGENQLQKLAGEISQELRDYNQANPDDEQGINKYVLGMVSSAAAGTLKTSDIKKIKSNLEGGGDDSNEELEQPQDNSMQEGKKAFSIIDEIVNSILDVERKQTSKRDGKRLNQKCKHKDNPFVSQW